MLASKLGLRALLMSRQFGLDRFATGCLSSSHSVLKPIGAPVVVSAVDCKFDIASSAQGAEIHLSDLLRQSDVDPYRHGASLVE